MPYTEFYCNADTGASSSSNLNGGSGTGAATATDASATYGRDTGAGALDRITASSGTPFSGVSVGEFAGVVAAGGSAPATFVCRVTAVNGGGTSIDVSDAAAFGTRPADSASVDVKVGGAWQGPNGSVDFPIDVITSATTNSSGHYPRVNFKNNAEYDITATMARAVVGPVYFQGYSSTVGDGGKAVFDGQNPGTSFVLLNVTSLRNSFADMEFKNNGNGTSGSQNGITGSSTGYSNYSRIVVHDIRGSGFATCGSYSECEAYACNGSNSSNMGGFVYAYYTSMSRCISHDNTGSNARGFSMIGYAGSLYMYRCIADTNGSDGFYVYAISYFGMTQCDSYNNVGDGLEFGGDSGYTPTGIVENCNFVKNGNAGSGYGIRVGSISTVPMLSFKNNRFGAGTQANGSGAYNTGLDFFDYDSSNSNYANDALPWSGAASGDFRVDLAAAKGAGRGAFTQTQSGYSGTVGYPDIGAAQHQDSGGGGGTTFFIPVE